MQREYYDIHDEEKWLEWRRRDVTSSDCAVLFNSSPYKTYYRLWHEKHEGICDRIKDNEAMAAGRAFEQVIAQMVADKFDLGSFQPVNKYIRIPSMRAGSSFDFELLSGENYEIKNVGESEFSSGWDTVEDRMPPHIEYQVQYQMFVSGKSRTIVGVMVGGRRLYRFNRVAMESVQQEIRNQLSAFWSAPKPEPDDETKADDIIAAYQEVETGKTINADIKLAAMAKRYADYSKQIKELKQKQNSVKAKILEEIGDAEVASGYGCRIVTSMSRRGYRTFRVSSKL